MPGAGWRAGVQKMFLASASAHSPSGKWIESLSSSVGADAFYSPEPLVDFLHEVNFPLGSFFGFHFCRPHFCLEIFLQFDDQISHSREKLNMYLICKTLQFEFQSTFVHMWP